MSDHITDDLIAELARAEELIAALRAVNEEQRDKLQPDEPRTYVATNLDCALWTLAFIGLVTVTFEVFWVLRQIIG